jgi:spore coat polysaccharide biosynthesis protein SpsF
MAKVEVAAIIQARRGSTRLPNKVIKRIEGKPMLLHVVERVKMAKTISRVYLATTNSAQDKSLERVVSGMGIETFFGNESDVLDRYYKAATEYKINHIVRITADCPLIDPGIIDKTVSKYLDGKYDYVSNTLKPSYPDGLDTEVFSLRAIEKAWREATKVSEREHVTSYIWNHPVIFRLGSVMNDTDLSGHRWTVDDKNDLRFVRLVYRHLYHKNPEFRYNDILNLLEECPKIRLLNTGTKRNEGYKKSLMEDKGV